MSVITIHVDFKNNTNHFRFVIPKQVFATLKRLAADGKIDKTFADRISTVSQFEYSYCHRVDRDVEVVEPTVLHLIARDLMYRARDNSNRFKNAILKGRHFTVLDVGSLDWSLFGTIPPLSDSNCQFTGHGVGFGLRQCSPTVDLSIEGDQGFNYSTKPVSKKQIVEYPFLDRVLYRGLGIKLRVIDHQEKGPFYEHVISLVSRLEHPLEADTMTDPEFISMVRGLVRDRVDIQLKVKKQDGDETITLDPAFEKQADKRDEKKRQSMCARNKATSPHFVLAINLAECRV